LQEASQAVVSILDEQSLIQNIMNLVTSVIGFERAILFLVDDKGEKLHFAQAVGPLDESLELVADYAIPCDRMSNIIARVAATGSPKFVKDVDGSDLRKGNIILRLFQPSNFAAAPLIARNKVIGVLAGEMPHEHPASEPDLNLLMAFSNQIAIAIENARLYKDLEKTYLASLQSQKMEAVGNLAGGIAHDFNNILQAIVGHVGLLLYDTDEQDSHHNKLKQIESSAHRASDLVRQLLTFSRKDESQLLPLNLNSEIKEVKELLSSTIPKMITVELQLSPDLEMMNADPVQMNQVLVNLAINARDAMLDTGKLVIGTKNVTLDEDFCHTHSGLRPGEHVMLWVSDTGHGMEDDVSDHIFEPFYTTKGMGKGTGLGLSTVYGIVKSHQGHIICESEIGKGTTFKLYFPTLGKPRQQLPERHEEHYSPGRGSETILVVDDEPSVKKYCGELLRGFGYEVLTAGNGEEALKVFVRERKRIDLVILDLIMAGMGGRQCLEEMLKIDPEVKIVVMTGYAVDDDATQALERGAKGILNKPFRAAEIGQMIRRVLDEEPISTQAISHKRGSGLRVVSSK
jgi:signal transduction histidine kinase/CheY-like chemotaxis protein